MFFVKSLLLIKQKAKIYLTQVFNLFYEQADCTKRLNQMENEMISAFIALSITEEIKQKLLPVLDNKDRSKTLNTYKTNTYTINTVHELRCLNIAPLEQILVVKGTSLSNFSAHPRPQSFTRVVYFNADGEGSIWPDATLNQRIQDVYMSKLFTGDSRALLNVAEIIGRLTNPFTDTSTPMPILCESHLDQLHQKYGRTISTDSYMRPKWLEVVHLPTVEVTNGSIIINVWLKPGEDAPVHNYIYLWNHKALWRLTITMNNGIEVQSRPIQHCYEEQVIERESSGNFRKNLNYKLFDTTFMHLVKRKFTGNEVGYAPGDDKFKKYFQMKLNRHKNVTPESLRFLLNNCCVDTLDLSQIHSKMHSKAESYLIYDSRSKSLHCEKCFECVKVALADDSSLKHLNLDEVSIDHYDGLSVNPRITHLSAYRTVTDLRLLDLFPNLESFCIRTSFTPKDVTPIERLTRLKHLKIHYAGITSAIKFEYLTGLVSLSLVDAWAGKYGNTSDVGNETVDTMLSHLPNLESINLSASRLTSMEVLGALKHLKRVEFGSLKHGECLTALTNITALKFKGSDSHDAHWIAIGQLTQLEEIDASYVHSYVVVEPHIAQLTRLKSLTLSHSGSPGLLTVLSPMMEQINSLMDKFDPSISRLTNLKSLALRIGSAISDQDQFYETIAKLSQLESLELSPLTNDGLGKLSTLVNLQEIVVKNQRDFDSDGAVHFKHFTKLRRVTFDTAAISDLGLMHLTKLEQLERLLLLTTNVSKDAIDFIENHRAYLEIN